VIKEVKVLINKVKKANRMRNQKKKRKNHYKADNLNQKLKKVHPKKKRSKKLNNNSRLKKFRRRKNRSNQNTIQRMKTQIHLKMNLKNEGKMLKIIRS
jgi:hypothetical protein